MVGAGNEVSQAEQEDEIGEDEQCKLRKFVTCEIPQVAKISQPGNSQAQKQPPISLQHLQNIKAKIMRSQTCK